MAILSSSALCAQSDEKILRAIGMVESRMVRSAVGDGGKALGAYQMHRAAWIDANEQLKKEGKPTHARERWNDRRVQDIVAGAYLRVIRKRLARAGVTNPSPAHLAACWNLGFSKANGMGFKRTPYTLLVETYLEESSIIGFPNRVK